MTVESERKVYTMHKNNRMELGCAIMTFESENRVYAMHKNRRIEPKFEKNDGEEKARGLRNT